MPKKTASKRAAESHFAGPVPSFKEGQLYHRRDEIHAVYGGSHQSGISPSATSPGIFLFTGEAGEQHGYRDGYDDAGVYSYSGEGQTGDMLFKAGNKAVRDHTFTGRSLYLFQSMGKGKKQKFLGEFSLANYSTLRGPDREGTEREIIIFHLLPTSAAIDAADDQAPAGASIEQPRIDVARQRALEACAGSLGPAGKAAVRTLFERSKAVRDYALLRAGGACEGCNSPAPFFDRRGLPYLEVHHTTRLSDGGLDHPLHVAALCPTCHRRVHFGQDGVEYNRAVISTIHLLESSNG